MQSNYVTISTILFELLQEYVELTSHEFGIELLAVINVILYIKMKHLYSNLCTFCPTQN